MLILNRNGIEINKDMKPHVVIRADGDSSIGMGHIVRCVALVEMIQNEFDIAFATQEPSENIVNLLKAVTSNIIRLPATTDYQIDKFNFSKYLKPDDIVVLDGYHFKTDYQREIKNRGCKLVCIDDIYAWHHVADVVINHAADIDVSLYSADQNTRFCLGLKYVLLRKPFFYKLSEKRKIFTIKKAFISMGAADLNNLTPKFTEVLSKVKDFEEIHLMLGALNPNLKEIQTLIDANKRVKIIPHFNIGAEELSQLIKTCDLAICPASNIALECCAIGIGLISGYTAENQKGILQGLVNRKTLINWGDLNAISKFDIKEKVEGLCNNPGVFHDLIINQKEVLDGKSPDRLLAIFKEISN